MKKEQVDLKNAVVWIPDSKTPDGIAEVPFTDLEAVSRADSDLRNGNLVVSERRESERTSKNSENRLARYLAQGQGGVLPHCGVLPHYNDLRSTYATRLSAGGVADEWVMQLLRLG